MGLIQGNDIVGSSYRCTSCQAEFSTREAIDGFPLGYSRGFVCPYCRANLVEDGESDDILHLRWGVSYTMVMVVVLLCVNLEVVEIGVFGHDLWDGLATLVALGALPSAAFVWVNWRRLVGKRVVFTRRPRN